MLKIANIKPQQTAVKGVRLVLINRLLGIFLFSLIVISFAFSTDDIIDLNNTSEKSLCTMTYNIRFDNPEDNIFDWEQRKSLISQTISSNAPDIMGIQEAYYNQVQWLDDELEIYDWYGVGSGDGQFRGEHCAIFYNNSKFSLLDSGTNWLSKNTDEPGSIAWDANEPNVLTWVKLKVIASDDVMFIFNTRLAETEGARLAGAKMVIDKIKSLTGDDSFILTGDFNSEPDHDSVKMFSTLCNEAKDHCFIKSARLDYTLVMDEQGKKIQRREDYVFFSNHFPVNTYEVVDNKFNSVYPSDHLPVVCKLRMP